MILCTKVNLSFCQWKQHRMALVEGKQNLLFVLLCAICGVSSFHIPCYNVLPVLCSLLPHCKRNCIQSVYVNHIYQVLVVVVCNPSIFLFLYGWNERQVNGMERIHPFVNICGAVRNYKCYGTAECYSDDPRSIFYHFFSYLRLIFYCIMAIFNMFY